MVNKATKKQSPYEKLFERDNAKLGSTLRIKFPEDYIASRAVTDPEEINELRETFWGTAMFQQELPPSLWERWTARILRWGRK